MDRLKVGIIGAGSISKYQCEAIAKLDTMKLTAVSSRNRQRAAALAESFGIEKIYTDYNELLRDTEVDAAVISTPTFTHHDIIMSALRQGKHVFCEKPPALNADDAAECAALAKEKGLVLMFGFVCRFSGRVKAIDALREQGRLGDIYYAEAVRTKAVSRLSGWFINKDKAGGGELFDGCIHEIDQVLHFMGYPEVSYISAFTTRANSDLSDKVKDIEYDWVSAEGLKEEPTVETLASGAVYFKNGSVLNVRSGRAMYTDMPEQGYTLLGTRAGIKYDNKDVKLTCLDGEGHMVTETVELPDTEDAFVGEFRHFADCCINGMECICSNDEAVRLMKILNGIYRSAETGRPVIFE